MFGFRRQRRHDPVRLAQRGRRPSECAIELCSSTPGNACRRTGRRNPDGLPPTARGSIAPDWRGHRTIRSPRRDPRRHPVGRQGGGGHRRLTPRPNTGQAGRLSSRARGSSWRWTSSGTTTRRRGSTSGSRCRRSTERSASAPTRSGRESAPGRDDGRRGPRRLPRASVERRSVRTRSRSGPKTRAPSTTGSSGGSASTSTRRSPVSDSSRWRRSWRSPAAERAGGIEIWGSPPLGVGACRVSVRGRRRG